MRASEKRELARDIKDCRLCSMFSMVCMLVSLLIEYTIKSIFKLLFSLMMVSTYLD